jgi:hypothetical protein
MYLLFPPQPTSGMLGDDFLVALLDSLTADGKNIQFVQNCLENTVRKIIGTGILDESWSGTLLTAGTGLQLHIAAHTAVNGFAATTTLDYNFPVPPSSTVYVWEFQSNSDDIPVYGTTLTTDNPGTDADLCQILCQVITDAESVTAITPLYALVQPLSAYVPVPAPACVPKEESFTLSWDSIDRSGGTLFALTLAGTAIASTPVIVIRGEQVAVPTVEYTISGSTITFLDGGKPIAGELVRVIYFAAS